MTQMTDAPLSAAGPLSELRVVDLASGNADLVARLWADLGADVLKIEIAGDFPGDGEHRAQPPLVNGVSLPYALHNANKRITVLDPNAAADRNRFADLVSRADIVVDSGNPGRASRFATSCRDLSDRYPHLVAMAISDFGLNGPKAAWTATDAVLYALSTALSRSRGDDGTPVLPPDGIASSTAAVQAAWAGLVAYYRRLRCGRGDYIDFSRYEAVLQALDPPFGSQGQAAAARRSGAQQRSRGRKPDPYPIFACKDGWVRLCVLAPRQWHGLRKWLGEPAEFQDPAYDSIGARFAVFDRIGQLIAEQFATQTANELVAAGGHFGVPVAALEEPADVLSAEQFRETGAFVDVELADGSTVAAPAGCIQIDGQRFGLHRAGEPSKTVAEQWLSSDETALWLGHAHADTAAGGRDLCERPFEGLRILDLGVIVAGGELGRLFSDLGAEVIKIENPAYPDGLRQTRPGQLISESFAWTHRNQSSVGLNLRDPAGARVFAELVATADVVLANFRPGTLAALGFSYAQLHAINPGIVLAESSAYGDRGPWSTRMGYGPLVRASAGITGLWADTDDGGAGHAFCDSTTVFPDHVVARITAVAALAVLIRRERTAIGGRVHVSQAEAAIAQLDVVYASESARQQGIPVLDNETVHAVAAGSGPGEWWVVSIRNDADWRALAAVLSESELVDDPRWRTQHGRWENRAELRAVVGQRIGHGDPRPVIDALQHEGVPAAPMYRAADILDDPHIRARGLYTDMIHPLLEITLPTETAPAVFRDIARADLRPAPLPGEQTRKVCRDILGYSETEIAQLIADGVLTESAAPTPTGGTS